MDRRENLLLKDMWRFYFKSISLLIVLAVKIYVVRVVAHYLAKFYEDRRDNYFSGDWIYKNVQKQLFSWRYGIGLCQIFGKNSLYNNTFKYSKY